MWGYHEKIYSSWKAIKPRIKDKLLVSFKKCLATGKTSLPPEEINSFGEKVLS